MPQAKQKADGQNQPSACKKAFLIPPSKSIRIPRHLINLSLPDADRQLRGVKTTRSEASDW